MYLTLAAIPETAQEAAGGSTVIDVGLLIAVVCIAGGLILLLGKREFLGKSRFLVARNGKMTDLALHEARLTGVQLILIGVLLIALAVCFMLELFAQVLILSVLVILVPVPFTVYRKKSKRYRE